MIAVLALALVHAAPAADAAARARSEEEAAFAAIDRKEWCPAMRHFLEADAAAPSVDFLLNAAMAAEYAQDRAAARAHAALAVERGGPRNKEARDRLRTLDAAVKAHGAGTPCPAPQPAAPLPPAAVESPSSPSSPSSSSASSAPPSSDAPADAAAGVLPLAVLGGGGVLVLAGGVLVAVGAIPWFQHGAAVASLRDAERSTSDDAGALASLQKEQSDARAAWEGWGQLVVIAGAAAVGAGVVAAVVGGALFFVEAE